MKLKLLVDYLLSSHSVNKWWVRLRWFLVPLLISVLITLIFDHHLQSSSSSSFFHGAFKTYVSRALYVPAHLQLSKTWNSQVVSNISVIHFPSSSFSGHSDPKSKAHRSWMRRAGKILYSKTFIVYSEPPDACTRNLASPPSTEFFEVAPSKSKFKISSTESNIVEAGPNWLLLADDTLCETTQKIHNAQFAGFSGIIIHTSPQRMISIQQNLPHYLNDFKFSFINVSFVTNEDGLSIKNRFTFSKRYKGKVIPEWDGLSALRQKLGDAFNFGAWNRSLQKAAGFQDFPKLIAYVILILMIFSPVILLRVCPTRPSSDDEYPRFEPFSRPWSWYQHEDERNVRKVVETSLKEHRCRELLGLGPASDRDAVNEAFRQNIRHFHPDKSEDKSAEVLEELTKKSQELIEARDFLLSLL